MRPFENVSCGWPDQLRAALQFKHRIDLVDRQKLTAIWSRFGLNNVFARFHHIPVICSRELEVMSAVKADICRGEQAVEAVGTVRFRDCISLADANYGARVALASGGLIQIFRASLSDRLRIFPHDRTSLLGTFVYRIQRNARWPVAAANRRPRATAKCYEE